jgi:hypothetical protein
MMNKYDDFISRFMVSNIQARRPPPMSVDYYNKTASYYSDRDEMIEIELPRKSFDSLVHLSDEYTKMWQDERDEKYMRMQHPAIQEAYQKYLMLLELYK